MNKIIVVLLLLITLVSTASAQKSVNPVIYTVGIPSTCVQGRIYVNVTTGFIYTFKTGVGCFLSGFAGGSFTSPMLGPDGSAAAPTYSFSNFTGKGLYSDGPNSMGFAVGGLQVASLATQARFYLLNNSAQISLGASSDVNLFWDAANTLALRNSTNAQALRVYNTYTDGSNFERGIFQWSSNVFFVGSSNAGTGIFREVGIQGNPIQFYTGASSGAATAKWQINSSGHLISVNGTEMIKWGTTSSFPALKRSNAILQVRLADDSAFSSVAVSNIFFGNLSDSGIQGVAPSVMRVNNGSSGGGAIATGAAVGSRPTCDSTSRGAMWTTQSGAGIGDIFQVCMKGTADTYAWRDVFTAP